MTQTAQFTPTLIQRLLGRQYKWWYIATYNVILTSTKLSHAGFALFGVLVNFTAISYVWFINGASTSTMTYLLLGRVYKTITDNYWGDKIGLDIALGKISVDLLRPIDYLSYNFVASISTRFLRNIINLIGIILVVMVMNYFGVNLILNSNVIYLILLLPIIICINFYIAFIIGSLGFFIEDRRDFGSFSVAYNQISIIMIGTIIPLDKLPLGLEYVLDKLPLAYLLHHPMQIYLGKYDTNQTLLVFAGGIAWCIILYFLAKLIFRLGLKRNEAVGL
jgi:ABC-2 type transport system permease protein